MIESPWQGVLEEEREGTTETLGGKAMLGVQSCG